MPRTNKFDSDRGELTIGDSVVTSGDYDDDKETVAITDAISKLDIKNLTRYEVSQRLKNIENQRNENSKTLADVHIKVDEITENEKDLDDKENFWNDVLAKFPTEDNK